MYILTRSNWAAVCGVFAFEGLFKLISKFFSSLLLSSLVSPPSPPPTQFGSATAPAAAGDTDKCIAKIIRQPNPPKIISTLDFQHGIILKSTCEKCYLQVTMVKRMLVIGNRRLLLMQEKNHVTILVRLVPTILPYATFVRAGDASTEESQAAAHARKNLTLDSLLLFCRTLLLFPIFGEGGKLVGWNSRLLLRPRSHPLWVFPNYLVLVFFFCVISFVRMSVDRGLLNSQHNLTWTLFPIMLFSYFFLVFVILSTF